MPGGGMPVSNQSGVEILSREKVSPETKTFLFQIGLGIWLSLLVNALLRIADQNNRE